VERKAETSPSQAIDDDALNAAHAVVSLRPLAVRVAELETLLAVESAEHARRLKEVDGRTRAIRIAVQNAQTALRHVTAERDELSIEREERDRYVRALEAQLSVLKDRAESAALTHDGTTAAVVTSAIARAQAADVELARLKDVSETLRARVREVESGDGDGDGPSVLETLDRYQAVMAERDERLARAAERTRECERAALESEQRAHRAELETAELRAQMQRPTRRPVASESPAFPLLAEPRSARADPWSVDSISHTEGTTVGRSWADRQVRPGALSSTHTNTHTNTRSMPEAPVPIESTYSNTGDAAGLLEPSGDPRTGSVRSAAAPTTTPEFPGIDAVLARSSSASQEAECDEPMSASVALGHEDDAFPGLRVETRLKRSAGLETFDAEPLRGGPQVSVHALPIGADDPDAARLDALLRFRHPNLVRLLRYSAGPGRKHLIAERAGGGERADVWVGRVGCVAERTALAVALQAARGLEISADRGVLHGDLAPSDLWIDENGGACVDGVGLRSLVPGSAPPAHPEFAAPECRGGGEPDALADIYSLGAVLYFLLTGCAPPAPSADDTAHAGGVPDPRDVRGDLSDRCAELVASLTAIDPAERPATWELVIARIEREMAAHAAQSGPASPSPASIGRALLRPRVLAGLLAIPLTTAAAVLLVQGGFAPTSRETFDRTVVRAERLARGGDVEGARQLYRKFLRDTGDPTVERDARSRLTDLGE